MTMKENKTPQLQTAQGLGMPAPTQRHQIIVGQMQNMFMKKFPHFRNHFLTGVAVLESPERIPDISIWRIPFDAKKDAKEPIISIEITHSTRNDNYSEVSIQETFDLIPSLKEAFIYNYQTENWTRFRREKDEIVKVTEQDYSQVLHCYLHTLLK